MIHIYLIWNKNGHIYSHSPRLLMYLWSLSLYGLSLLLLQCKQSKQNVNGHNFKNTSHLPCHVHRLTTYLRNTTTTTIAATTRRNAAPPITEPTSRGSRFWTCCECSSVGKKVISAVDVSLRQYLTMKSASFQLFPELETKLNINIVVTVTE